MPSFSSCFRKTSRVELESSVLLIFRDVFVAYVDLLPIQTLANIFSCTLSFRPDMSRATLIRQMFQAVLDNKVLNTPSPYCLPFISSIHHIRDSVMG